MTEKEKNKISRLMSLVLRHEPETIGVTLDANGWVDVEALIEGISRAGYEIRLEQLKDIVSTNNKQRFKFNDDFTKIRANQGHSVSVNVELKEVQPTDVLYHGTATRFLASIQKEGIVSKSRMHVHLSDEKETALNVGSRHGKPVVLVINAVKMHEDGYKFYLSDNGVWLVEAIPPKYIYQ